MTIAQRPFAQFGWDIPNASLGLTEEKAAQGVLGGFNAQTDLAACVMPLLTSLSWEGDLVQVAESLPHFADKLDLTDVLNVMAGLGYASRSAVVRPSKMDARLMPCLFIPEQGGLARVLIAKEEDGLARQFDSESRSFLSAPLPDGVGTIWLFRVQDDDAREQSDEASRNYVGMVAKRFRPMFARMLIISMLSNILILSTPLFIMSVYDQYLPSGSASMLAMLVVGVLIAVAGDHVLKNLRSQIIAHIGSRLDHILGLSVFRRLMMLSPAYTEQANSNSQIARMRDFEMVREFFTGPMATSLAEAPFVVLFLLMMALLGGPLVLVPLGAVVLFVLVALAVRPMVTEKLSVLSRAATRRQEFLVEALSNGRVIKEAGAGGVWCERYRNLSADVVLKSHRSARVNAAVASMSQALVTLSGLFTLGWGVDRVLNGDMTVGQLMATMMIVWWVLRPLQTAFSLAAQIERVQASIGQINRLMQLKPERSGGNAIQSAPKLKGKLTFSNVSLRYSPEADPALLGVSFQANPGDVVALVGPNGSGKSSVLKMILGLYRPQTGAVLIDDIDIRQVDPLDLRRSIAYVPQRPQLFYGTVAQNLRLVNPIATDEELRWACDEAGVLEEILALDEGFETRIGDSSSDRLPVSLRQRLSLARAYLKRAPVTLFDEPAATLDFMSDRQFMMTLERMKKHSTIVLVTHRPSHLKLADQIVVLIQGQVRMAGPAQQVMGRLPPGLF